MRIKLLRHLRYVFGNFPVGAVIDIPEADARFLVEKEYAEAMQIKVHADKKQTGESEA